MRTDSKALNTWPTLSTTPATRKARHERDTYVEIAHILGRTDNNAKVNIQSPDFRDAVSDHMLMTFAWTPKQVQGPKTKEHDEARRQQRRDRDLQDAKFATYTDRRRLSKMINMTILQTHVASMKWDRGGTFPHNMDRVNREMDEAARRAHQEEGRTASKDNDRGPHERWQHIKELITRRNATTDFETRRARTKEVDRKRQRKHAEK